MGKGDRLRKHQGGLNLFAALIASEKEPLQGTLSGLERTCTHRDKSVVNDPNVWSGRAEQEDFVEVVVSGLASMYPAFGWSIAPGHHGYQRACELISG
jgi:hypothetical protein